VQAPLQSFLDPGIEEALGQAPELALPLGQAGQQIDRLGSNHGVQVLCKGREASP
jgi:hypothetical protein